MKQLKLIWLTLLLSLACVTAHAAPDTPVLTDQLVAADARFFRAVFVEPDEALVMSMLAPDFTFTANGKTRGREHFVTNLKKMWQSGTRMRRELVQGSAHAQRDGDRVTFTGVQKLYAVADGHEQLVETTAFRRSLREKGGHWIILSEKTYPVGAGESARVDSADELSDELAVMDRKLFTAIFDQHDLEAARAMLTDDFEFYHDRNGLVSRTADAFIASMASHRETGMQRRLVAGSMHTYPLRGFGAIQQGVHEFYRAQTGQPLRRVASARFMHVWERVGDGWKLKREFSYDHKDN